MSLTHLIKQVALCCTIGLLTAPMIFAQITIDKGDMPRAGDEPIISVADTLQLVDAIQAGANVSWDFSDLKPITQQKDSFVNVPFFYQLFFTGADVVQFLPTPDSIGPIAFDRGFRFFNSRNDRFEDMGLGLEIDQSPAPITLRNNPEDVWYRFPLTFGNTDTNYSESRLDLAALGLFYQKKQTRISIADAWGEITTPYGTFPSLRVKAEIVARDSIVFDTLNFAFDRPKQVTYRWLGKDQSVPLLEFNTVEIGGNTVPVLIRYKDSLREEPTVGIAQPLEMAGVNIYPNPASDEIQIDLKAVAGPNMDLEILSLEGKVIWKDAIRNAQMRIPVRRFPPAMYIVRLKVGQEVFTGKLLVKH